MIFCCTLGSISDTRSWCSDLPYGPGGSRRFRSPGCSSKYFASPPVWCPLFGLDDGRQYRRDPPVAPARRHAHGVARLVGHHRHPLVAFPLGPAAPVVYGPVYVRAAPLAVRVVLASGSVWVWPCLCSCSLPGQRSADQSAFWSPQTIPDLFLDKALILKNHISARVQYHSRKRRRNHTGLQSTVNGSLCLYTSTQHSMTNGKKSNSCSPVVPCSGGRRSNDDN